MNQKSKIAIVGAGGRTGKYLVNKLISAGYRLRLLLRDPNNFNITSPSVEIIEGDAMDLPAIRSLVSGCHAVISTIGQREGEPSVHHKATRNLLLAMDECQIHRYIIVAGLNIDMPFDKKSASTIMATDWMKEKIPLIQKDRQDAYTLLLKSTLNWTLVRVPFIEFTDDRRDVIVSFEDCPGNKIGASDFADFLAGQLTDITYIKAAPFLANV